MPNNQALSPILTSYLHPLLISAQNTWLIRTTDRLYSSSFISRFKTDMSFELGIFYVLLHYSTHVRGDIACLTNMLQFLHVVRMVGDYLTYIKSHG